MAGRHHEESSDGRDRQHAVSPEPARVSIISDQGQSSVNILIGSIEGRVSIGEKSTVEHIYNYRPAGRRNQHAHDRDSDSGSDSNSDSDDDMTMYPESAKEALKMAKKMCRQSEPKAASNGRFTEIERQTQLVKEFVKRLKVPNKIVDQRLVHKILSFFGEGWRRVFRHLGLKDVQIDDAFQDNGNVQETVQQLLLKWTEQSEKTDVQTLTEALLRADHLDTAEYLIKLSNAE